MQETFRRLLHEYRVESFKAQHSPEQAQERTREALKLCREALHQVYRFHFHDMPDAQRAQMLNLVHDYAVEALLPPIIERVIERELVLERKHELAMRLVERVLEVLSNEAPAAGTTTASGTGTLAPSARANGAGR